MADVPSPKTPAVKKPPIKPVATPAPKLTPKPKIAPAQSSPLLWAKKAWKKLDDWNMGISGKALVVLMIIGFLSEIYYKL
jgi:hypothetical protein